MALFAGLSLVRSARERSLPCRDRADLQKPFDTQIAMRRIDVLTYAYTHLPTERQEVHDVIHSRGVLDVAPVDVHGVLHLFHPSLRVQPQLVHVGVGHQHEPVHDRVELCGDGAWRENACNVETKILPRKSKVCSLRMAEWQLSSQMSRKSC